jgi:hypothetical protein
MTTGTNHFQNLAAANKFYSAYGYSAEDVGNKIQNGEIKLGPPKTSLKLFVDKDGRYFIA